MKQVLALSILLAGCAPQNPPMVATAPVSSPSTYLAEQQAKSKVWRESIAKDMAELKARKEERTRNAPAYRDAAFACVAKATPNFVPGGTSPEIAAGLAYDSCRQDFMRYAMAALPSGTLEDAQSIIISWRASYVPVIAQRIIQDRSSPPMQTIAPRPLPTPKLEGVDI